VRCGAWQNVETLRLNLDKGDRAKARAIDEVRAAPRPTLRSTP
jgi:hypothetical protein